MNWQNDLLPAFLGEFNRAAGGRLPVTKIGVFAGKKTVGLLYPSFFSPTLEVIPAHVSGCTGRLVDLNFLLGVLIPVAPSFIMSRRYSRLKPSYRNKFVKQTKINSRLAHEGSFDQFTFVQGLTLATYDRRTIPPLLKTWAEEERTHGGVGFVDERTISPADIGGLVWALTRLARETGNWDWTNRIYFLRR